MLGLGHHAVYSGGIDEVKLRPGLRETASADRNGGAGVIGDSQPLTTDPVEQRGLTDIEIPKNQDRLFRTVLVIRSRVGGACIFPRVGDTCGSRWRRSSCPRWRSHLRLPPDINVADHVFFQSEFSLFAGDNVRGGFLMDP